MATTCLEPAPNRQTLFWATQPSACGEEDSCGSSCGAPGLEVVDAVVGATISSADWIRGLVLNMLFTDGRRPDTPCGYAPGSQGGHWSESYMTVAKAVGTLVRTIEPQGRVNDIVNLLSQYTEVTLQRLVDRGVATSVEVNVSYLGGNSFSISIEVLGTDNRTHRVAVSGTRSDKGWIWENYSGL